MVGGGSPTALQGRMMSLIHGVVTVPLNVRIRAGANRANDIKQQLLLTLIILIIMPFLFKAISKIQNKVLYPSAMWILRSAISTS